MTNNWQDWKTNPPPIITCQIREGCLASVLLVVIDQHGDIYDDVFRGDDGLCHCVDGGIISDIEKWTYAPNAWDRVVIDKAGIEIELIKRLQISGVIPDGDPEAIVNDLLDPVDTSLVFRNKLTGEKHELRDDPDPAVTIETSGVNNIDAEDVVRAFYKDTEYSKEP